MSDHLGAERARAADVDPPRDTVDPAVDAVLVELTRLADLPVDEHLGVYDRIHERLRNHLMTVDAGDAGAILAAGGRPGAAPRGDA